MNNDRYYYRFFCKSLNRYVDADISTYFCSDRLPVWQNGDHLCMVEKDDLIPEQCVGMRDKNKKMICENDILAYPAYDGKHFMQVKWKQDTCRWVLDNIDGQKPLYIGPMSLIKSSDEDNKILGEMEVVGNVHFWEEQYKMILKKAWE